MGVVILEQQINVGTNKATATPIPLLTGDGLRIGIPSGSALDTKSITLIETINGNDYTPANSDGDVSLTVAAGKSYQIDPSVNVSKTLYLVCSTLGSAAPVDCIVKKLTRR